jgi:16S rRNA (cytosine1402-N4)-methyltransferase
LAGAAGQSAWQLKTGIVNVFLTTMTDALPSPQHSPVLLEQVLEYLDPRPDQTVVDCTCGLAGHSLALAGRLSGRARLVCLDQDDTYFDIIRRKLSPLSIRTDLIQSSFGDIDQVLADRGIDKVDVIFADLGLSSAQLDDPQRGFTFQTDAPLDMRIDKSLRTTAAELVNSLPETELADLLFNLGDERFSRKIARAIYQARHQGRITRTFQLANLIARALGVDPEHRAGRIHPATRTFMALRIAVNQEFEHLEQFLAKAPGLLAPGGRIGVISFHSGEDRLIKVSFQQGKQQGFYEILTRKPITPTEEQTQQNPRSRSAKLRVARRV